MDYRTFNAGGKHRDNVHSQVSPNPVSGYILLVDGAGICEFGLFEERLPTGDGIYRKGSRSRK